MNVLNSFRDHCRGMSNAEHTPECDARVAKWERRAAARRWFDVPDPGPRPECGGCVSDKDRALFARLADEVDDYLDRPTEPDLFGEVTEEPTRIEADQ